MSEPSGFDNSVIDHGTAAITQGSHSFAAAAKLFDPAVRESAVMLYAWCRHCDDVIDGQSLGYTRSRGTWQPGQSALAGLRVATRRASEGDAGDDPVFAGIGEVVRRCGLPPHYLDQHLDGFAMDVEGRRYRTLADTLTYCWHVAGVVGVMMCHVMGSRAPATLDRACDLGIAFQLTNIARDIVEDAGVDRIYLPADWLAAEGLPTDASLAAPEHRAALARVARRLVEAAEPYYASAYDGLGDLPWRSAWSIATARGVYRAIGRKVLARGPAAWDSRAGTNRLEKLGWVVLAALQATASRWRRPRPRDAALFRRPV
ncbi:phytoene/squalene synthase family protein [Xylophilus sp. GOD-11R]|uniref:phytoene/squalene synthase family protein n=1 Tax=Xylophilus sp. GOD-11R TaxID=3089814 RepID=UPI00298C4F1F|nr:phytoene/squalene synthase family protein [Xylophilus sp. GOD-11R]WPB55821.1 phytoene/squalene synthase family protein [Xylophilus sp. GOD-11R]